MKTVRLETLTNGDMFRYKYYKDVHEVLNLRYVWRKPTTDWESDVICVWTLTPDRKPVSVWGYTEVISLQ